jgi:hypothetical protein
MALEPPLVVSIACDRTIDGEYVRLRVALDDGQVGPFNLAFGPCSGELRQGVWGAGEEHRAAGQAIETMDQTQKRPPAFAPGQSEQHLLVESVRVAGPFPLRRLGKDSCRLGGDEYPGVFEQRFRHGRWRVLANDELGLRASKVDDVTSRHGSGLHP